MSYLTTRITDLIDGLRAGQVTLRKAADRLQVILALTRTHEPALMRERDGPGRCRVPATVIPQRGRTTMFLIGYGTEEERQRLEEAGYDLLDLPDRQLAVAALDGDVMDLLAPPFCPYCGRFMGDPETYYEDGAHVLHYRCGSCGAEERQVRRPPAEGGKDT